jgi:hypothetical protein
VGVSREARHDVSVVHAPALLALEVPPDAATLERCRRAQCSVAARIRIIVVHAKQEGVEGRPRWLTQGHDVQHDVTGQSVPRGGLLFGPPRGGTRLGAAAAERAQAEPSAGDQEFTAAYGELFGHGR